MRAGMPLGAWLAAVLLLAPALAPAQVPVPPLAARVTDLTSTLNADQRATIERKLADLEKRDGSQVAVLMVPTVQPETVEQYATRVFETWKLGKKNLDDGVLLLVAKNDRKLRIEVGYGLEGAIPDAIAKRIIEEDIVPRFKQGDFHGGILSGVDRIVRLVDGEKMPAPRAAPPGRSRSGGGFSDLWIWAFLVLILIGAVLRALIGRLLAASVVASVAGLATFLAFGAVAAAVVAFIAFLLTVFDSVGTASRWMESYGGASGGDRTSGSGGWSSGSGGWSSSDSGGFSGGGGSSGGGGASGSW